MNIDRSTPTPAPRARNIARPGRSTPCAGLFGWRKDAAPPGAPDGKPVTPGYDYPAI